MLTAQGKCRIKGCNEQTLITSPEMAETRVMSQSVFVPPSGVPCPTKQIHTKLFLEMLVAKNVSGCSFLMMKILEMSGRNVIKMNILIMIVINEIWVSGRVLTIISIFHEKI